MVIKSIKQYYLKQNQALQQWVSANYLQLGLFNICLILLLLLRSAGYFEPYFPLSINFIIFISLVLMVLLLGVKSKPLFILAALFWIFACLLRLYKINIWAERTAIYTFQALLLGVVTQIIETFGIVDKIKDSFK